MKICILGSNGMMGGMAAWFFKQMGAEVEEINRDKLNVHSGSDVWLDLQEVLLDEKASFKSEWIINCIGAIKPAFKDLCNHRDAIYTNAIFPRELADFVEEANKNSAVKAKVIHITTDCVFSGIEGKYTENSAHDARDDYGKSKSLGEPHNAMVIRTSIIGPEFNGNKKSLIEWYFSQPNDVPGYSNHLWNGVTTLQLSKAIHKIITYGLFEWGTFHVFSNDISKYDLLRQLSVYRQKVGKATIIETKAVYPCDRTMRTVKGLNAKLNIPMQHEMINELGPWLEERSV